jgi:outer membrane receptor for ferrienterochelin and colicins
MSFRLKIFGTSVTTVLLLATNPVYAQPVTGDDSTITYPASYFEQYQPFSVSDMLDRIPGINIARQDQTNSNSTPGSSSGANRRGLGLGGDQILIDGRRTTGKGNEGNSQLSRIPANQVQRIEIIRGTSGDLDVRGGTQVINIVLIEAESRSSFAYELGAKQYHDSKMKPSAKVSLTGQSGRLDYLLSAETLPAWEFRKGFESSILADGSANDNISRKTTRDSQPLTLATNLGYQISENDIVHFNTQYDDKDAPTEDERTIFNRRTGIDALEFDDTASTSEFWEIGGDYEHTFGGGSRWKSLFIVNQKEDDTTRERFDVDGLNLSKDLFLGNFNRYQERIARTSYSFGFGQTQGLEIGIERAQTILDSSLQLGVLTAAGTVSNAFGGLTPITDSNATVEEIRYESFLVHNWQINDRMSLESTLIVETSEIEQSGDISKKRDFNFVRPKVDYRFDITPSLQFRATVEKDVAQLSFNDFTANINGMDDDQDAVAGNPDLRQEQSWRYDLNLEYRFDNGNGVLNTNIFFQDLEDVIDRIDVSTLTSLQSAKGNIGDGERYGAKVDASLRLDFLDLPQVLISSSVATEDSSVIDPFRGSDRRLNGSPGAGLGRGTYNFGFRHDVTSRDINYGLNYQGAFNGGNVVHDIDKIESYSSEDTVTLFIETQGWAGLTFRFEVTDPHERYRCRIRQRYTGGTIATGSLSEIEDSCSRAGEIYELKIRGTF